MCRLLLVIAYLTVKGDASGMDDGIRERLLSILHQNDIHSHFGQVTSRETPCWNETEQNGQCFGGFARAAAYVKWRRKNEEKNPNELALLNINTGGFFQGHIYYSCFGWEMVADMVSLMSYNVLGLSSKEFHDGLDNLVRFMRRVGEKFVCTNIHFPLTNFTLKNEMTKLCPEYRIFTVKYRFYMSPETTKVAVFGYTTPDTALIAKPGGVTFEDEVTALNRAIAKVDPAVKVFLALGNSGLERDKQIARQVPKLDIIVGGHSHSLLWPGTWQPYVPEPPEDPADQPDLAGVYPEIVRQPSGRTVLVVQAFKHGKYMGFIDVEVDKEGEVKDWWPDIFLLRPQMTRDAAVAEKQRTWDEKLAARMEAQVGRSLVTLNGTRQACFHGECNFGNLFADALVWANMRYETHDIQLVNVAIVDSGSLHTAASPRNFTLKDVQDMLPHMHTFTVVNITGETLLHALEHSAAGQGHEDGIFLQVSGLRVVYNMKRPRRVVSAEILCSSCSILTYRPVLLDETYGVIMPTDLADGEHGYTMIRDNVVSRRSKNLLDLDIVVDYLKTFNSVYPRLDGRIRIVDDFSGGVSPRLAHGVRLATLVWPIIVTARIS